MTTCEGRKSIFFYLSSENSNFLSTLVIKKKCQQNVIFQCFGVEKKIYSLRRCENDFSDISNELLLRKEVEKGLAVFVYTFFLLF